ncbi:hypothetical protein BU23DRAFT_595042 [Bimuria novae-zelandiae CBS 107.79]|uniref:Uncharacterized protein n=1 Tax=Bimuria novae-zelandiae CBS 107.79 TaxID=1447943 RepID=A0A6A5VRF1_9PLEO|nr:hypothetical protein BU23DRAFT_595042 [Bimuria novae-zelandiae CBS 107.79]
MDDGEHCLVHSTTDSDGDNTMGDVAAVSTKPFRFMDLPKETRLMVYERIPINTKAYGTRFGVNAHDPLDVQRHGGLVVVHNTLSTGILRTSRAVYDESRAVMEAKLTEILLQPVQVLLCAGVNGGGGYSYGRKVAGSIAHYTDLREKTFGSDTMRRFSGQLYNRHQYFSKRMTERQGVYQKTWIVIELACAVATDFSDVTRTWFRGFMRIMMDTLVDEVGRKDIMFALRVVRNLPGALTKEEEQEISRHMDTIPASQMVVFSPNDEPYFHQSVPVVQGQPLEQNEWAEDWVERTYFREHAATVIAAQAHGKKTRGYGELAAKWQARPMRSGVRMLL